VVGESPDGFSAEPIEPNLEHAYVHFLEQSLGEKLITQSPNEPDPREQSRKLHPFRGPLHVTLSGDPDCRPLRGEDTSPELVLPYLCRVVPRADWPVRLGLLCLGALCVLGIHGHAGGFTYANLLLLNVLQAIVAIFLARIS